MIKIENSFVFSCLEKDILDKKTTPYYDNKFKNSFVLNYDYDIYNWKNEKITYVPLLRYFGVNFFENCFVNLLVESAKQTSQIFNDKNELKEFFNKRKAFNSMITNPKFNEKTSISKFFEFRFKRFQSDNVPENMLIFLYPSKTLGVVPKKEDKYGIGILNPYGVSCFEF